MHYSEFLERLHLGIRPAAYMEIGVAAGGSLMLSRSRSVAIDPAAHPDPDALLGKPWVKLYQLTSDDFFLTYTSRTVLEDHPVDLVLIDGDHAFAQVVRDLEHVERWSHPGTVVVIHGILPQTVYQASHYVHGGDRTGDAWRVVPFLREHRPDLICRLVATEPTGVLIVTGLDAKHRGMSELAETRNRESPDDGAGYDRLVADWLQEAQPMAPSALLRQLPHTRHVVEHAMETCGWSIGTSTWEAGKRAPADPLRIVFREPIRGAHRLRLTMQARGMDTLRFRLQSSVGERPRERDVYLAVSHPGALHHDLDALWLDAGRALDRFELDWEGALAAEESLTGIGIAPVDFALRDTPFTTAMNLDLQHVSLDQILWPRSGSRYVPERFPDRPLPPKRRDGKRDAVVLAWWIPGNSEAHKVGEYYLGLLRHHHPDSKIFVGINHGSDPAWIDALKASGIDVEIARVCPDIEMTSDVGGFLAALGALSHSSERFDLVWFGHTKGASRRRYDEYIPIRFQHQRRFWSRRAEIEHMFDDPKIGVFCHRYGLWDLADASIPGRGTVDIDALLRIYRDVYAPLGLTAWETVFVMRASVVRAFCQAVGDDFFRTNPEEWGADRWWFEGGFPSIASMQGFEPYIELETDGDGALRDDILLYDDPRQSNRLAMKELRRWREDPFAFRPHGLRRGHA